MLMCYMIINPASPRTAPLLLLTPPPPPRPALCPPLTKQAAAIIINGRTKPEAVP